MRWHREEEDVSGDEHDDMHAAHYGPLLLLVPLLIMLGAPKNVRHSTRAAVTNDRWAKERIIQEARQVFVFYAVALQGRRL